MKGGRGKYVGMMAVCLLKNGNRERWEKLKFHMVDWIIILNSKWPPYIRIVHPCPLLSDFLQFFLLGMKYISLTPDVGVIFFGQCNVAGSDNMPVLSQGLMLLLTLLCLCD